MNLSFGVAFTAHLLAGEWNEVHPQARLDFDSGWFAGAYYNSESSLSVVGGYRWEIDRFWIEAGLVTGYESSPVLPALRAGYALTDGVDVFILPAATSSGDIGAVLGLEFTFGE